MENNTLLQGERKLSPSIMHIPRKVSRSEARRAKRKRKRQAAAKLRDAGKVTEDQDAEEEEDEEEVKEETKTQDALREEQVRLAAHAAWLERESLAQAAFEKERQHEESIKQKELAERKRIQEEWEEQQRKEEEEKEKKDQELESVLDQLDKELGKDKDAPKEWRNPEAPPSSSNPTPTPGGRVQRKEEMCSFFMKTGACRFKERCSRTHPPVELSTTLMIPGMYTNFGLGPDFRDEYDADVGLECDEESAYENFYEFYDDVLPECKEYGRVIQLKVCRNWEPHLRGNVYVQYSTEDEAAKAFDVFNGRFYGGKQLTPQYCPVNKWKPAICGLFHRDRCPRGKHCNFLHVFINPGREFAEADQDLPPRTPRHSNRDSRRRDRGWDERRRRSRSRSRSRYERRGTRKRSRSRSRGRRSRSRSQGQTSRRSSRRRIKDRQSRSRSRSRERKRRRSRSRSRERLYGRNRRERRDARSGSRDRYSRSRSRERLRSRSKERLHSRSRSKSRERPMSHSQRRNRSKEREGDGKRKRSRSRSRERSEERTSDQAGTENLAKKHRREKDSGRISARTQKIRNGSVERLSKGRSRSRSRSAERRSRKRSRSRSGSVEKIHPRRKENNQNRKRNSWSTDDDTRSSSESGSSDEKSPLMKKRMRENNTKTTGICEINRNANDDNRKCNPNENLDTGHDRDISAETDKEHTSARVKCEDSNIVDGSKLSKRNKKKRTKSKSKSKRRRHLSPDDKKQQRSRRSRSSSRTSDDSVDDDDIDVDLEKKELELRERIKQRQSGNFSRKQNPSIHNMVEDEPQSTLRRARHKSTQKEIHKKSVDSDSASDSEETEDYLRKAAMKTLGRRSLGSS